MTYTKTVDLQFKDLLSKNKTNYKQVMTWFNFSVDELAELDYSEIESAEKGLKIEIDVDGDKDCASAYQVFSLDDSFPEACQAELEDIAFNNSFWL